MAHHPPQEGFSTPVLLELFVDGQPVEISHVGPENVILRQPNPSVEGKAAKLVISIGSSRKTHDIMFFARRGKQSEGRAILVDVGVRWRERMRFSLFNLFIAVGWLAGAAAIVGRIVVPSGPVSIPLTILSRGFLPFSMVTLAVPVLVGLGVRAVFGERCGLWAMLATFVLAFAAVALFRHSQLGL